HGNRPLPGTRRLRVAARPDEEVLTLLPLGGERSPLRFPSPLPGTPVLTAHTSRVKSGARIDPQSWDRERLPPAPKQARHNSPHATSIAATWVERAWPSRPANVIVPITAGWFGHHSRTLAHARSAAHQILEFRSGLADIDRSDPSTVRTDHLDSIPRP